MSGQAMGWALDQDLPAEEKFVLVMVADNGGSDETREISLQWVVRRCGLQKDRADEILRGLETIGLLKIDEVTRHPGDLVFRLTLDHSAFVRGSVRMPRQRPARGHLYVMMASYGACKVGITTNLAQRARTLAHMVGVDISLIWSHLCEMDAAREFERELLTKFAAHRLNGEWLSVSSDEIIQAAKELSSKYGAEP